MSTAGTRRSRSLARAPSGCWRQSDGWRKTSRSSGTANESYEHYRAHGRDSQGRRLGRPPKPFKPPETPAGKINTPDPDSRNLKTPRSYNQSYNRPAVVGEEQIALAAEGRARSPDVGPPEPMVQA